MSSGKTPGARLKAYLETRWGRSKGGMEALAVESGLRGRQTLYEWFAGAEPSLAALGQVAAALGVRRVDLVAAYDGDVAPESTKEPRPEWAEALPEDVAVAVVTRLTDVQAVETIVANALVLERTRRQNAGAHQTEDQITQDER